MRRTIQIVGLSLLTLAFTGCMPMPGGFDPADLPAALAAIVENESDFTASDDDPLLAVTPGTVIDDPNTIVGCWGSAARGIPSPAFTLINAWQFRDDGTFTSWGYQRDDFGLLLLLTKETGTYRHTQAGEFEITTEHIYSSETFGDPTLTEVSLDQPLAFTSLLTVSGDSAFIVYAADDPNSIPDDELRFYVYKRFDCPNE